MAPANDDNIDDTELGFHFVVPQMDWGRLSGRIASFETSQRYWMARLDMKTLNVMANDSSEPGQSAQISTR